MSYKDVIKRSHPYPGDQPETCTEEVMPMMTGHNERVESPQEEPKFWSDPHRVEQAPAKRGSDPHDHDGDALISADGKVPSYPPKSTGEEDDHPFALMFGLSRR